MSRFLNIVPAVTAAAIALGSAGMSVAEAETFVRSERINRDVCYKARKVPAKVLYDTRGQKLRDASRSWHGNMQVDGGKIVDRYNDEVYIQTRKVIEDQHVTLVRVPC